MRSLRCPTARALSGGRPPVNGPSFPGCRPRVKPGPRRRPAGAAAIASARRAARCSTLVRRPAARRPPTARRYRGIRSGAVRRARRPRSDGRNPCARASPRRARERAGGSPDRSRSVIISVCIGYPRYLQAAQRTAAKLRPRAMLPRRGSSTAFRESEARGRRLQRSAAPGGDWPAARGPAPQLEPLSMGFR